MQLYSLAVVVVSDVTSVTSKSCHPLSL